MSHSDSHLGVLKAVLRVDEGESVKPYFCTAGKITIGVGHNLSDRGLSKRYIEWLLEDDIQQAESDVRQVFGGDAVDSWSEPRKVAVVSLMFNIGINRFLGFVNMIEAIRRGDWSRAGKELLDSKWRHDVDPKNQSDEGRDNRLYDMMVLEKYHPAYGV